MSYSHRVRAGNEFRGFWVGIGVGTLVFVLAFIIYYVAYSQSCKPER